MKRIVNILGLKDKEGNCYSYGENDKEITLLSEEGYVNGSRIRVFPFNTFNEKSSYDQERFKSVILEVLLEFKNKGDYFDIYKDSENTHQYKDIRVLLLEENENPLYFAWRLYQNSLSKQPGLSKTIKNNILCEQMKFGFSNMKEIEVYKHFLKEESAAVEFPITKFNAEALPHILNCNISISGRYLFKTGKFGLLTDDYLNILDELSDRDFVRFHEVSDTELLKKFNPRINSGDFFMNLESTGSKTMDEIVSYMPEKAIREFTGDLALKKIFPTLNALVTKNGYTPETWHYSDEDDSRSSVFDIREAELEMLEKILPHVTHKSVALLKELYYEMIEEFLPENVKKMMNPDNKEPVWSVTKTENLSDMIDISAYF